MLICKNWGGAIRPLFFWPAENYRAVLIDSNSGKTSNENPISAEYRVVQSCKCGLCTSPQSLFSRLRKLLKTRKLRPIKVIVNGGILCYNQCLLSNP